MGDGCNRSLEVIEPLFLSKKTNWRKKRQDEKMGWLFSDISPAWMIEGVWGRFSNPNLPKKKTHVTWRDVIHPNQWTKGDVKIYLCIGMWQLAVHLYDSNISNWRTLYFCTTILVFFKKGLPCWSTGSAKQTKHDTPKVRTSPLTVQIWNVSWTPSLPTFLTQQGNSHRKMDFACVAQKHRHRNLFNNSYVQPTWNNL